MFSCSPTNRIGSSDTFSFAGALTWYYVADCIHCCCCDLRIECICNDRMTILLEFFSSCSRVFLRTCVVFFFCLSIHVSFADVFFSFRLLSDVMYNVAAHTFLSAQFFSLIILLSPSLLSVSLCLALFGIVAVLQRVHPHFLLRRTLITICRLFGFPSCLATTLLTRRFLLSLFFWRARKGVRQIPAHETVHRLPPL